MNRNTGCDACVSGYYADQLSVAQEVRGNRTVRVKNESRGFHLNNLSYAGPIVMGVGGLYSFVLYNRSVSV
jgi:hypothetical protein